MKNLVLIYCLANSLYSFSTFFCVATNKTTAQSWYPHCGVSLPTLLPKTYLYHKKSSCDNFLLFSMRVDERRHKLNLTLMDMSLVTFITVSKLNLSSIFHFMIFQRTADTRLHRKRKKYVNFMLPIRLKVN